MSLVEQRRKLEKDAPAIEAALKRRLAEWAEETAAIHRVLARQMRTSFRRARPALLATSSPEEWAIVADQEIDRLFTGIQRTLEPQGLVA